MSLIELRDAMVSRLQDAVPAFVDVAAHGGRFDAEELGRWATKAPCLRVGYLGALARVDGGAVVATMTCGAFLVAKDGPGVQRDVAAIALLEQSLTVIRQEQRWGVDWTGPLTMIRGDNLFTGKLDQRGIAMWAITWKQDIDLQTIDLASLDDFLTYNVKYDLAESPDDAVEAEDTVTLPGP